MLLYKRLKAENKSVLKEFFEKTDNLFPIPLSAKQDINQLCEKLFSRGFVMAAYSDENIAGVLCGYSNDAEEGNAYVSVLCVLPEYRGKSIAKTLMKKFIEHCLENNMKSIFLYTHKTNEIAISLYKKLGFTSVASDREGDIKLNLSLGGGKA